MKTITALEAKAGQTVRYRIHGKTITGLVVSSQVIGTQVKLVLALDKENICKRTSYERQTPTGDWVEMFGASVGMTLVMDSIINEINAAEAVSIQGIKLIVPELFAQSDFQDYVNNTNVMTWHSKKGPIAEGDFADVAVFVDPSMTGEGTDSEMPYWGHIIDKLKTVIGEGPFSGSHIVVILTNS